MTRLAIPDMPDQPDMTRLARLTRLTGLGQPKDTDSGQIALFPETRVKTVTAPRVIDAVSGKPLRPAMVISLWPRCLRYLGTLSAMGS